MGLLAWTQPFGSRRPPTTSKQPEPHRRLPPKDTFLHRPPRDIDTSTVRPTTDPTTRITGHSTINLACHDQEHGPHRDEHHPPPGEPTSVLPDHPHLKTGWRFLSKKTPLSSGFTPQVLPRFQQSTTLSPYLTAAIGRSHILHIFVCCFLVTRCRLPSPLPLY